MVGCFKRGGNAANKTKKVISQKRITGSQFQDAKRAGKAREDARAAALRDDVGVRGSWSPWQCRDRRCRDSGRPRPGPILLILLPTRRRSLTPSAPRRPLD